MRGENGGKRESWTRWSRGTPSSSSPPSLVNGKTSAIEPSELQEVVSGDESPLAQKLSPRAGLHGPSENWRSVLDEEEFIVGRTLQQLHLQQEKLHGSSRVGWAYEYEPARNGTVRLGDVQKAPYHALLAREAPLGLKAIFHPDPELVLKEGQTSWVHVFDHNDNEKMMPPELCSCTSAAGQYHVESLERLRSKTLTSSVVPKARLIIVEELSPLLWRYWEGAAVYPAYLFKKHVGMSWGGSDDSAPLAVDGNVHMSSGTLSFAIPQPALLPVIWDDRKAQVLDSFSKHATRGLQENKIWPILETVNHTTYSAVFQQLTVLVQYSVQGSWRGVVLAPPSVRNVEYASDSGTARFHIAKSFDRTLGLARKENFDPLDFPKRSPGIEASENWGSALEDANSTGLSLLDPMTIVQSLFVKALDRWTAHVAHVSRAVEIAVPKKTERGETAQRSMTPQIILKKLIIKDTMLIAEVLDSIKSIRSTCNSNAQNNSFYRENNVALFSILKAQMERCIALMTSLERLLPTLQHEIDVLVVEQQVRLAQTQLEESRKGIEQSDTIKRLTILAFIYIPIQTAGTLFGMNIKELLNDAPSVWKFVVTAVALLLVTISAAGWLKIAPVFTKRFPSRLVVAGVKRSKTMLERRETGV